MVNWCALAEEILHSISLCIDNPFDLVHFRSVCSSWRSSSVSRFRPIPPIRCPLPLDSGGYGDDCHILRSRVYLFKSNCEFARYWLLKLRENKNGELVLSKLISDLKYRKDEHLNLNVSLDLLNCQVIELAQGHFCYYSQWSESLECVQNNGSRVGFMQLGSEYLIIGMVPLQSFAMYRSFEKKWTDLSFTVDSYFEGMVSFKGKFYGIDHFGVTTMVEPSLEVTTFHRSRPWPCDKLRSRSLVKSVEKLLLVEMYGNIGDNELWFVILELDEERNDWYEVEDVGGHVLFLDYYYSFMCLAYEIPGFRPNSIIFTGIWNRNDDIDNGYDNILVFDIENKVVGPFADFPDYADLFKSPLGWVISNA